MDEVILKYWPLILAAVGGISAWVEIKGELKALRVSIEDWRQAVKDDISRLEAKQDKYNHLQERTTRTEESLKSAHKRLSEAEERIHEYHR